MIPRMERIIDRIVAKLLDVLAHLFLQNGLLDVRVQQVIADRLAFAQMDQLNGEAASFDTGNIIMYSASGVATWLGGDPLRSKQALVLK